MLHTECHAAFTLPEHVVATGRIFAAGTTPANLEIRFHLANLETRSNLEYPADLDVPHKRTSESFHATTASSKDSLLAKRLSSTSKITRLLRAKFNSYPAPTATRVPLFVSWPFAGLSPTRS